MAFALQYEENMHPVSGWFYSDDPFKDLRGSNQVDSRHRFRIIDIEVGAIESEVHSTSMRGRAGSPFQSKDRKSRTITVTFDAWADSTYAFPMLRDFIQHIFETKEPFYFYEDWRPKDKRPLDVAINSKRFYVIKDDLSISRVGPQKARATVDLVTTDLPYGISTGTTKDIIDAGGIKFSTGLFGWQEFLYFDETTQQYRHQMTPGTPIRIYNPSSKKVKHFEACMHVKMSDFSNVTPGAGVGLTNATNITSMKLDKDPISTDVYEQENNLLKINGFNEWEASSKSFIELEPGWNEISIEGASAEVDFLFHFYY